MAAVAEEGLEELCVLDPLAVDGRTNCPCPPIMLVRRPAVPEGRRLALALDEERISSKDL